MNIYQRYIYINDGNIADAIHHYLYDRNYFVGNPFNITYEKTEIIFSKYY